MLHGVWGHTDVDACLNGRSADRDCATPGKVT
jgi:hypothetical protein